jgi:DNA repair exonuclease SbcCD nuclease subunit
MKIAILCDTHAGIKNSSDIFLNYAEKFYGEVFFPYCLKHDIKRIVHLGDYFDNRKVLYTKTLSRNRSMFLEKLREYGMTMDIIPGNHDCAFKNTNDLCSLVEILSHYDDCVNVHMTPTVVDYDGMSMALLPWITAENYAESMAFVETANAPIIGAHLELQGFEMMKGAPSTSHGMDASLFHRYEMVLSGHYHTKSSNGNIHYLGVAYEHTWADCNDPKYFHVLDTSKRQLIAVRNSLCIFKKLVYDDTIYDNAVEAIKQLDLSHVSGSFVKVIVAAKKDPYAFDKYIDKINACEPFDLKIVESYAEYQSANVQDDSVCISDTSTLLNTYVDSVETDLDKEKIKSKLQELYAEAQQLDAL